MQTYNKKITALITSENPAKTMALKNVLAEYFDEFEILNIKVNSGVSKTPLNDEEAIDGCMNRINEATKVADKADLIFSLEGLISTNQYGTFLYGWCVVNFPKKDKIGLGCSAKVQLPNYITKRISNDCELSDIVKKHCNSKLVDQIDNIGTNGIITGGKYTRVDEFEDAIKCALGYLLNPSNFSDDT